MAICPACKREKTDRETLSCDGNQCIEFATPPWLKAVPFEADSIKKEADFYRTVFEKYLSYQDWYTSRIKSGLFLRCSGCFVHDSGFHHPGCDQERCPRCKGQLISCRCNERGSNEY